ncbi:hypothetical protein IJS77_00630 [bacterium]|nr:hypothetical protein [bacterium]
MSGINSVNFKGYVPNFKADAVAETAATQATPSITKAPEKDEFVTKKPQEEKQNNTSKKVGVTIASALIPGLGQAINGEWGKAAGFFFGTIAAGTAVGLIFGLPAAIPIAKCIGIAARAWSAVDACQKA